MDSTFEAFIVHWRRQAEKQIIIKQYVDALAERCMGIWEEREESSNKRIYVCVLWMACWACHKWLLGEGDADAEC